MPPRKNRTRAGKKIVKTAPKVDRLHPISSIVYIIVRHTRSGDVRQGVFDDNGHACDVAERIAEDAANAYGYGSTSVYRARLTLLPRPKRRGKGAKP